MKYGWQLDSILWKRIPDELKHSNEWVMIELSQIGADRIPKLPGIYMFCASPVGVKRTDDSERILFGKLYTPIYIGQTNNLRRRFIQHISGPSAKLRIAISCYENSMKFWFHKRDEDQIRLEEAWLINCFGPSANEVSGSIRAKLGKPKPIGR